MRSDMDTASSVTVRPWRPTDDISVLEGFVATYNGEPWNDSWTVESAAQYLGEFRAMPRSTTLVAVAADRVVGAVYFHARTWQDASEIFIDEFFVFPASQRQGIGHALMAAVRDRAAAEGAAALTLITDREMPAFGFYAGLGFREGSTHVFMIG
ncbi:GNAT family N-acetyltransferase [Microbacterium sp. LMI12-1-1.1]|uniref:GNAT family N-acetyltransferase n=1 Tax=Microbacterium sp. LMI12-1-1.1 TaxID=3135225 RepID=UPI0034257874